MSQYTITNSSRQYMLIAVVALGALMSSLDSTIVNISLPTIAQYFNVNVSVVSWVILAYLLVLTSFLLAFGKLADFKGFKKIFILGLIIFTAGSFFCGAAWSINALIALRVIQAVGGAMMFSICTAIIVTFMPREKWGRLLGIITTFAAIGIAIGPPLGGFLTAFISWRWIFYINVPVGIVTIIIAARVIPAEQPKCPDVRYDLAGAFLFFLALITLLFTLNMGQEIGWLSIPIILSAVLCIVSIIVFIKRENKISYPVLDFGLFRNSTFTFANTVSLLNWLVYAGAVFLLPFYLERLKGYTVDQSGLILMVPSLIIMFLGLAAGYVSEKTGCRALCCLSMFMVLGSFIMFAFLNQVSGLLAILVFLIIFGIGQGTFIAPNTNLIMQQITDDKSGIASSVLMTARRTGMVLGVCFFETIFSGSLPRGAGSGSLSEANILPETMAAGFRNAFIFGVFICLAALVFSILAKDKGGQGSTRNPAKKVR